MGLDYNGQGPRLRGNCWYYCRRTGRICQRIDRRKDGGAGQDNSGFGSAANRNAERADGDASGHDAECDADRSCASVDCGRGNGCRPVSLTLEAQPQSSTYRAPWKHSDVVRFSALLVEEVLSVNGESHASAKEEAGSRINTRYTAVVLPVGAKLPPDEILKWHAVVGEGTRQRYAIVVDPVGGSRDVQRRGPAALCERRIDSERTRRHLEH